MKSLVFDDRCSLFYQLQGDSAKNQFNWGNAHTILETKPFPWARKSARDQGKQQLPIEALNPTLRKVWFLFKKMWQAGD